MGGGGGGGESGKGIAQGEENRGRVHLAGARDRGSNLCVGPVARRVLVVADVVVSEELSSLWNFFKSLCDWGPGFGTPEPDSGGIGCPAFRDGYPSTVAPRDGVRLLRPSSSITLL